MQNHSYDLHQPTDSFHDNQTHFYMKGFTQRLVVKQRHKDTFIFELLTRAFDYLLQETFSAPKDERVWKNEWGGDVYPKKTQTCCFCQIGAQLRF